MMNLKEFALANLGKEIEIKSNGPKGHVWGMIVGYTYFELNDCYKVLISLTDDEFGWDPDFLENHNTLLIHSPLNRAFWNVGISDFRNGVVMDGKIVEIEVSTALKDFAIANLGKEVYFRKHKHSSIIKGMIVGYTKRYRNSESCYLLISFPNEFQGWKPLTEYNIELVHSPLNQSYYNVSEFHFKERLICLIK